MAKKDTTLDIVTVKEDQIQFCILGKTPIIMNRMANKVLQELLLPKGRKTSAEKKSTLKHDPYQEFRDAPYLTHDPKSPTYIQFPAVCFKNAIRCAALDVPGATKAAIGRLLWVHGVNDREYINLYGVPRLRMDVARLADMNKTPDVRTRACMREWACRIEVSYVTPILSRDTVANLLAAAGLINGMGEWRGQKGSGSYGQFEVVAPDDTRFNRIVETGGREAQIKAMEDAEPYNDEAAELLAWFDPEVKRRGFEVAS